MAKKKTKLIIFLLIGLLAAVLAGVTIFGVVRCSEKSKEDARGAEVGQYYCYDGDEEYALNLSDGGKFDCSIKGSQMSGSYTNKDGALTLTYANGTLTAKLKGNAIVLTYDGIEMTFYKKMDFTVSFDTKGGSTVDSVTVRNGKKAPKPADPQKEGFAFVAWYSDSDCAQAAYDFSSVVTENITLYAKWIDSNFAPENERLISFDLCYADAEPLESRKTVGGKLYNAPEPQREGYAFAGWWISMYGDREKLSYKFAEGVTEFDGDATLYALWYSKAKTDKLAAPQADIQNNLILWNSVENATKYKIEVSGPSGFKAINEDIPSTSKPVKFSESPAGDYVVKVTAIASQEKNNSDTTFRYYINKWLKKVPFFKVENGALLFGEVEHADKYLISVDCGDKNHNHTELDIGKRNTFDFSDCAMQEGGIRFTVKAVAANYAPSVSEFTYGKGVYDVKNLAFDEDTQIFAWDAVDGITNYRVHVSCENAEHKHGISVNNDKKTSFCIKEYEFCDAKTTVSVHAEIKGYKAGAAAELSLSLARLATPSNIRITGNTLSWNEVKGATSYTVKVGETEVNTNGTQTSLELNNGDLTWSDTDYTLSIRANGAQNSLWSDPLDIRYYAMYATLNYSHSVVSWRHVVGAVYYEVKVNDGTPLKIEDGANFAEIALTKAGDNSVSVRFNDGSEDSEWATFTVFAYTVTYDANGGSANVELQYKADGDKMNGTAESLPVAEKQGYDFRAWYNTEKGPNSNGAACKDDYFYYGADVKLYAYYAPKSYTVTLYYDDGRPLDGTEKFTVLFGMPFTLPVPNGVSEDKSFGGWFGESGGKGLQYTDEVGASIFGWPRPENVELHAFWRDLILDYTETEFEGRKVYSVAKGLRIYGQTEIFVPETYKGLPVILGPNAFYGCTSVKKISIPDSILSISEVSPFGGCTALQEIEIRHVEGNNNIRYWTHGGVLYDSGRADTRVASQLTFVPTRLEGEYAIPADKNVTSIKANAFENVAGLTKVVIPASVTDVGSQAFKGCIGLAEVIFSAPESKAAALPLTLYDWAFEGCSSLAAITLPARLKTIPLERCLINDYTFNEYDYEDFGGANFITDITSRYDYTDLKDAFKGCSSLSEIHVEAGNENYSSEDGILYDGSGAKLLYCPSGRTKSVRIRSSASEISDGAFYGSKAVYIIEIPSNVTKLGELAFYKSNVRTLSFGGGIESEPLVIGKCAFACTSLENMTFESGSNVSEFDSLAFYDCKKLTSLGLPKTLQKVGYRAFYRCSALTEVAFADNDGANASLTFGGETFNYCAKLETLTLPKQAKNLPGFVGCSSLKNINVSESSLYLSEQNGAVFDKAQTTLFYFPENATEYKVPESVTAIAEGAFRENKKLQRITLGKNLQTIGKNAFYQCEALTEVIFASGGSEDLIIEANAFYNCSAITALNLPSRIRAIGDFAFYKVGELSALTFGGADSRLESIGESAFAYTGANTVRIPKNVTVLSAESFAYSPVKRITFEDGSRLSTIAYKAFYCSSLTSFTVPNTVTVIAPQAFADNASLAELIFVSGGTDDLIIGAVDSEHKEDGYFAYGESFARCTALASVFLPSRTTELGYATFYGCSSLKTVTFAGEGEESGLKFIPDRAFAFSGLTSVIIPKSVRNCDAIKTNPAATDAYHAAAVSEGAFAGCVSLQTVTFESGNANDVTIDKWAFKDCALLTKIVLPANITSYTDETGAELNTFFSNSSVFDGCTALQTLEMDNNEKYKAYEGIIYNSDFSAVVVCPPGIKRANIHDNVKTLNSATFSSCKSLTYISIPATLSNLVNALKASGRTIDVRVNEGQTDVIKLDNGVLCAAENGNPVAVLYVPDTLTGTFEIPKTVTRIAELAFNESKLSQVTFEESSNSALGDLYIESSAFMMSEIAEITLPARLVSLGENAFISCGNLSSVTFDANCRLSELGNAAFYKCVALASIEFPASVKEIPDATGSFNLFGGCANLTSITFGDGSRLEKIGSYAFAGSNINSIEIPASVTVIGEHAFDGSALTSVQFGSASRCETIGAYAFYGCGALSSFQIPASVKTVANGAFGGCGALASVTVGENSALQIIGNAAFSGCTVLGNFAVPSGVTNIGDEAFLGCASITYIALPFGVRSLGRAVFSGCTSLASIANIENVVSYGESCFARTALTEFVLPNGITELAASLFERCTKLTTVVIPDTVHTVGENAFNGCSSLASVKLPVNARFNEIPDHMFSGCRKLTEIALPNTVKTIGSYAFSSTGINEFVVPDSVMVIKSGAFSGCVSLRKITGLRYVTQISSMRDGSPFDGCVRLTEIELPVTAAFTTISSALLQNCTGLTHIKIPSNVQRIESYAFAGCTSLQSVEFEGGVNYIGAYAFYNCQKLNNVTLPSSMRTIANCAFGACYGLEAIELNYGLQSLGHSAFANCTRLSELALPATLYEIGSYAFRNCLALRSAAVIPASVTSIGYNPFAGSSVESYSISGDNAYLRVENDALIAATDDGDVIIAFPSKITGSYTIQPNMIVGPHAFEDSALGEIVLSPDVRLIYDYDAYSSTADRYKGYNFNNSAITRVVILGKNQSITICAFGFAGMTLSDGIYFIGSEAEWLTNVAQDGNRTLREANRYYYSETYAPGTWHYAENEIRFWQEQDLKPVTYSFRLNNGEDAESVKEVFLSADQLPKPQKDDCVFDGWYDNAEFSGKPIKFPYFTGSDATLYAKWANIYDCDGSTKEKAHRVTLDAVYEKTVNTKDTWFAIMLLQETRLKITVRSASSIMCALYDSDGSQTDSNNGEFVAVKNFAADTYYLNVAVYYGANDCTVRVEQIPETEGSTKNKAIELDISKAYEQSFDAGEYWFKLTLSENTAFNMYAEGASLSYIMYNDKDVAIKGGSLPASGIEAETGVYYLKVYTSGSLSGFTLKIAPEPGSSMATAAEAELNKTYSVKTSGMYWLKFTPDISAKVIITASSYLAGGTMYAYIYDESGALIKESGYAYTSSLSLKCVFVENKTYYVAVRPMTGSSLSVTFAAEQIATPTGLSKDTAVEVDLSQDFSQRLYADLMPCWFTFTLSNEADIQVNFIDTGYNDIVYVLFDEDGNTVANGRFNWGESTFELTEKLKSGKYYLLVNLWGNSYDDFTINIAEL